MDFTDLRTFKMAYIGVAALIAICAIALAAIHQDTIAVVLIVIGCVIIFIGSVIYSRLTLAERLEKLRKM